MFATRLLIATALAGLVVVGPAPAADAPKASTEVPEQSQIRFEQERAEAHMRELEQRMFRLAELLKADEPDDASRLRLGVEKAREELIAERMKSAGAMLDELKLSQAAGEQRAIIEKLEELRRLLLSIDIDLELKLEQLKKLRDAQKLLANLIDRETDQKSQTAKAAEQDELKKRSIAKALAANENRNKRLSEDLIAKLARFGNQAATASGQIGKAGSCMGGAGKCLSKAAGEGGKKKGGESPKRQGAEAEKKQAEALKNLAEAEANLRQLEEQLNKDLEKFVLRRAMETLQEMIAQQQQIREETERLSERAGEKQESALAAVRDLEIPEAELLDRSDYVIELCELVQLSMTLPAAMDAVASEIELVADDLADGDASRRVIDAEYQIEEDLTALLDALKEASKAGGQKASKCKGCNGSRNKLLAEVKMLRWMQGSLLKRSERLEAAADTLDAADLQRRSEPLSDQQREIQKLTLKLHDSACKDCLGGT